MSHDFLRKKPKPIEKFFSIWYIVIATYNLPFFICRKVFLVFLICDFYTRHRFVKNDDQSCVKLKYISASIVSRITRSSFFTRDLVVARFLIPCI